MPSLSKIAKKHYGQNCLIDETVKNHIIEAADISSNDTILEIGPGLGALTEKMIERNAVVYAIEKDPTLIPQLSQNISSRNLHMIQADFLKYDLTQLPKITKVIGNIPYNISTPIIERLIEHHQQFEHVFLTTQLEFAKRLTAKPGTKDYGSLTCFAQYYADISILFKIKAHSFRPIPQVTSCFLKLHFCNSRIQVLNEKLLFQMIHIAFQQRRKKLPNALAGLIEKQELERALTKLNIKEGRRADQLSLNEYIQITNYILRENIMTSYSNLKTNVSKPLHD